MSETKIKSMIKKLIANIFTKNCELKNSKKVKLEVGTILSGNNNGWDGFYVVESIDELNMKISYSALDRIWAEEKYGYCQVKPVMKKSQLFENIKFCVEKTGGISLFEGRKKRPVALLTWYDHKKRYSCDMLN